MVITSRVAMRTIPAGEFKAKCLAIMDEIQAGGESVVITKRGKPVVRVTALEASSVAERRPVFGAMRGLATIVGEIVESEFSDEEWERMENERFASYSNEKTS
jgi:prevent-host-death family protein